MFGCCDKAMQIVYIDKDRKYDQKYIDANYPVGSKVVPISDETSPMAKFVFTQTGEYPTIDMVVDPTGNKHKICTCSCHHDGIAVMC